MNLSDSTAPLPAPRRTSELDAGSKALAVITIVLGALLVSLLAVRQPGELGFPACPLHWLTGLHCPGCGSLRAMHFLLAGDVLSALRHNVLAVLMIPVVAWLWFREAAAAFGRQRSLRKFVSPRVAWFLFAIILLFGVSRNLKARPFTLLAPPPAAAEQF